MSLDKHLKLLLELEKAKSVPDLPRSERALFHLLGFTPRWVQQESIQRSTRFNVEIMHRRAGKALALDTEVPMADGSWSTMGALQVGDLILGADGYPTTVTAAHEVLLGQECFAVTFNTGEVVVADAGHLWSTTTKADRTNHKAPDQFGFREHRPRGPSVRTTQQIAETLRSRGEVNHRIRICGPIRFPSAELPVDPYILGAWLGDGTSRNGDFTTMDLEIVQSFIGAGYAPRPKEKRGRATTYAIPGLGRQLAALDLIQNKHIPQAYLTASAGQRLSLVQGLMDTDGYADPRKPFVEIIQKNQRLAEDIVALLRSLGMAPSIRKKVTTQFDPAGATYWRITVTPRLPLFRLPRKLSAPGAGADHNMSRSIVSCERVASVPVRCIEVDASDKLFLVTRSYIPTHNSVGKIVKLLLRAIHCPHPNGRYAYIAPTYGQAEDIAWNYLTTYARLIPGTEEKISRLQVTVPTLLGSTATIRLYGVDSPKQRLRGAYLDGVVLDEYQDTPESVFTEQVRPMLSDTNRHGVDDLGYPNQWADFIGCVAKDTLVLTREGFRRIGDLDPGKGAKTLAPIDLDVFGAGNAFHKADGFWDNGIVATRKISTAAGFSLEASLPHPVWTRSGWKKAEDLVVGDEVLIQRGMDHWPGHDPVEGWTEKQEQLLAERDAERLPGRGSNGPRSRRFDCVGMSADLAYFLGLWVAEGSFEEAIGRVTITCGDDVSATLAPLGFARSPGRQDQWRCNSRMLLEFLRYLGMPLAKAPDKRLPLWVMNGRREWAEAFLAGYLDGDGHAHANKVRIGATSASRGLLADIQILLLNLGVVATLTGPHVTSPTKRVAKTCPSYRLTIGGHEALRLRRPFWFERKAAVFRGYKAAHRGMSRRIAADAERGEYWTRVTSLEPGQAHTVDFTIPETHSFFSSGLLSHNTPKGRNQLFKIFQRAQLWGQGLAVKDIDDSDKVLTSNEWNAAVYPASKTGILTDKELASALRDMGRDKYDQEYECSFDAAIVGAIFAKELAYLRKQGRIGFFDYQPALPVHTAWDLGWDDDTAIWFFQVIGNSVQIIDYAEMRFTSLKGAAEKLAEKPYFYGKHFGPHDLEVTELGSGRTRKTILGEHGVRMTTVPKVDNKQEAIDVARHFLYRCYFNLAPTLDGVDKLALYHRKYDEKTGTFGEIPSKLGSHAADALMTMAMALRKFNGSSLNEGTPRQPSGEF